MAIQIIKKLTKEQYIKLFSNPVSGIACEIEPNMIPFENEHSFGTKKEELNLGYLNNIRYSKSMMLGALNFWFDKLHSYYLKIYKIRKTSLIDVSEHIVQYMVEFRNVMNIVECLPDSFLFSHRYIQPIQPSNYSSGMRQQSNLLSKKHNDIFFFQEGSLQPYKPIKTGVGIEFTVFPNEHPYIPRDKISRVGMTEKGNVYIMMSKDGARKK